MTSDDVEYLALLIRYLKKAEKKKELVDIDSIDLGRFLLIVSKYLEDDFYKKVQK